MELIEASFLERLNRFVVKIEINGKKELAYLPNPGRLWELLLPGRVLLLSKSERGTYPYMVIACRQENFPVLLHTHLTNNYVADLIQEGQIPSLRDYVLIKREPKAGKGRLDLLLENQKSGKKLYLEVKTCTLFGEKLAMFPDAETKRGTRHLYELLRLRDKGYEAGCLFVVMSPKVKYFLPAYHIDFDFTEAFLQTYGKIKFEAISVKFSPSLEKIDEVKRLEIPFEFLRKEFKNSGAYLLILEMKKNQRLEIARLGNIEFKKGFYVYVGLGRKNLIERVKRHLRKNKKKKWHIDYLTERAHFLKAVTIVSSENLECLLVEDIKNIADDIITRFGASDCKCPSHLFYFKENPLQLEKFIHILNYYRLERPAVRIEKNLQISL
ncbi:MAG: DNA/RNA nuclease SfsA [Caldimicrobium sp.]